MVDSALGLSDLGFYDWIGLLFLLAATVYWFGVSGYTLTSHVCLPGPKPWPYVGNLLDASKYDGLHNAFLAYTEKYGKVFKMYMGRDPIIAVADPEILKNLLVKDFHKFRNRPDFLGGRPPLSKGLFGARDNDWKRVRSILTPTFSSLKMKEIVPIIEEAAGIMASKFENLANEGQCITPISPVIEWSNVCACAIL